MYVHRNVARCDVARYRTNNYVGHVNAIGVGYLHTALRETLQHSLLPAVPISSVPRLVPSLQ